MYVEWIIRLVVLIYLQQRPYVLASFQVSRPSTVASIDTDGQTVQLEHHCTALLVRYYPATLLLPIPEHYSYARR